MKKKFILLLLVGLLLALLWDVYYNTDPTIVGRTVTRYVHQTEQITADERYGQALRNIADQLLAPLDVDDVNRAAELTRIRAMADREARQNEISPESRRLIIDLCNRLERINAERERQTAQYRRILDAHPRSLHGPHTAQRNRQFFIDQQERLWKQETDHHRPLVMRDLTRLRDIERERESQRSKR